MNVADSLTQSQKIFHEQNPETVSSIEYFVIEFARYNPTAPHPLLWGDSSSAPTK
jgi:hypothetical protein